MSTRKRCRGITIVESLIALSVVAVILGLTVLFLAQATESWRRVSGDQSAGLQLQKAEGWLRRDLELTAYETVRVAPGMANLNGSDGDALWFLSALDPATGQFLRNPDGTPRWQRNILYYSVVPSNLGGTDFEGAGLNVNGYESSYPYKVLVRKQIDFGESTGPDDTEQLITNIQPYLERPNGLEFASNDAEVTLVAHHLLSFRAVPEDALRGVLLTLQAAGLEQARKAFPIGSQSLLDARFLLERRIEIFPANRLLGPAPPP